MDANAWKGEIGDSAFRHVVEAAGSDETAAAVLTRLYDAGWRAPTEKPNVVHGVHGASKVLWPSGQSVLTAQGLVDFLRAKGNRFYLLRVEQFLKAVAGPGLDRWQQFLVAYEAQCRADGVEPLAVDDTVFVGGEHDTGIASKLGLRRAT